MSDTEAEHALSLSRAESTDRITLSVLQYYISINLAVYGGLGWLLLNDNNLYFIKIICAVFLSAILFIVNVCLYNIYLRTYLLAIKHERNEMANDVYRGITHKTISFALSLFCSLSFGIFLIVWHVFLIRTDIIFVPIVDFIASIIASFVLVLLVFFSLFENSKNKVDPLLLGMRAR